MKVVAKTHCGKVRPINEDRYLVPEEGDSIVLVADGMGGHKAGEVASETAAQTIRACAVKMHGREISIKTALKWVRQANQIIYRMANEKPECMGMGTTMTFLYFMDKHALLAHVGDSRCYLLRQGELIQVTEDHTAVAVLLQQGLLSPEEAAHHPDRHAITRAIGVEPEVQPDYTVIDLLRGDALLLCSDGLYNTLPPGELAGTLQEILQGGDIHTLIAKANAAGGPDNITAVLIHNR